MSDEIDSGYPQLEKYLECAHEGSLEPMTLEELEWIVEHVRSLNLPFDWFELQERVFEKKGIPKIKDEIERRKSL